MPYLVSNKSDVIIDGHEQNAGDRVFARAYRNVIIDGAIVGTAGLRQFVKDQKLLVITGGRSTDTVPHVTYTTTVVVTGTPRGADIYAHPVNYVIEGLCSPHSSAPVALRGHTTIIIEDAPQETPP